ncbi:MAG: hypothetical protein AAB933_03520 [Patescibacteria group bacterium]
MEEFSNRTLDYPSTIPNYNNFFLFFVSGPSGDVHRKKKHFERFVSEHPSLNLTLHNGIGDIPPYSDVSENLKPYDQNLYEVYKIMRSYGVSDKELFA